MPGGPIDRLGAVDGPLAYGPVGCGITPKQSRAGCQLVLMGPLRARRATADDATGNDTDEGGHDTCSRGEQNLPVGSHVDIIRRGPGPDSAVTTVATAVPSQSVAIAQRQILTV